MIGTVVIVILLWWGFRSGHIGVGSVIVGLLAGLAFASTSMGAPIATAVRTSATSVGTSLQAGLASVGDS